MEAHYTAIIGVPSGTEYQEQDVRNWLDQNLRSNFDLKLENFVPGNQLDHRREAITSDR